MAELKDRDWENFLGNIRRGRSVLFVGPNLGASAEAAVTGLARHLGELLREEGESVKGQSLPAVAQQFEDHPWFGRSDLEREAERFYTAHTSPAPDAEVYARLAALSFALCVTTCHDLGLERALRATPKAIDVARYHFRSIRTLPNAARPRVG